MISVTVKQHVGIRFSKRETVCETCEETVTSDWYPAEGWYSLKKGGQFDHRDATPGPYCSLACLTFAVLRAHGFDRQAIWDVLAKAPRNG